VIIENKGVIRWWGVYRRCVYMRDSTSDRRDGIYGGIEYYGIS